MQKFRRQINFRTNNNTFFSAKVQRGFCPSDNLPSQATRFRPKPQDFVASLKLSLKLQASHTRHLCFLYLNVRGWGIHHTTKPHKQNTHVAQTSCQLCPGMMIRTPAMTKHSCLPPYYTIPYKFLVGGGGAPRCHDTLSTMTTPKEMPYFGPNLVYPAPVFRRRHKTCKYVHVRDTILLVCCTHTFMIT